MKKNKTRTWLLIALTLGILLSLPISLSQKTQSLLAGVLAPLWKTFGIKRDQTLSQKMNALTLENTLLKNKLHEIKTLFIWEHDLKMQADDLARTIGLTPETFENLDRNYREAYRLFDLQVQSYPAKVIYRSPTSWNSTLWIDIGERDNQKLGRKVISKNSPVVLGDSLVGVVEVVNPRRSLVRLITDPQLTPSVRALRDEEGETLHLAKGELHGSANVSWRSRGEVLIGEGFNYDYEDEYGPAQDLRAERAILNVGDLLVTTGMDGVFPKGLKVATVSKIQMLREGDYYYQIEATPTAAKLEELNTVTVLPALD